MIFLVIILIYGGAALLLWGLIYLAVKHGVLNAMRQLEKEREDAADS